jgi:hypothetical protein
MDDEYGSWRFSPLQLGAEALVCFTAVRCARSLAAEAAAFHPVLLAPRPARTVATAGVAGLVLALAMEYGSGSIWFLLAPCQILSAAVGLSNVVRWAGLTTHNDGRLHSVAMIAGITFSWFSFLYMQHVLVLAARAWNGDQGDPTEAFWTIVEALAEFLVHAVVAVAPLYLTRRFSGWEHGASGWATAFHAIVACFELIALYHAGPLALASVWTGLNIGFVTALPVRAAPVLQRMGPFAKVLCTVTLPGLFWFFAFLGPLLSVLLFRPSVLRIPSFHSVASVARPVMLLAILTVPIALAVLSLTVRSALSLAVH